jgi:hypothetical protein
VQEEGILCSYQLFFIALVILTIVFTILRLLAVKQYRLKRKGDAADSMLVSLGDIISNTRMSVFDIIYIGIFIIAQSATYSYLTLLVGYGNLLLPVLIFAIVFILVSVVFLFCTVRGKAYRRTERILDDHQTLGHEDWVIQKHLAKLLHESEGDNFSRAEIAKATLKSLKGKENRTGDTVRLILENPEQLRDIEPMKIPPSLWKSLRCSLLILIIFAIVLVYFVYSYISGSMPYYDFFMNGLALFLMMSLVLACCLCVETPKARKANREARLGI